ncbi:hypothetical protein H9I45_10535 [Polaribacter haliotis]|uniref:Uncharacterized protein n=1 Tax=Polaribacter haliotis TaxID=1888915 RepID=A0A7L8ACR3_9FLAO|nr:hypothetical protein [Polaribacter haliotis]QOD59786.1 hypothetical protein H9I45_10535 [Polaribacter haliotis]
MKKFTLITLFALFAFGTQSIKAQSVEKKIIATYKGMTVSDNFKFEDSKGNPIVFHDEDQSFESKLTLVDEGLIGKKFVIYYKWVNVNLFDNATGLATGETMNVKRIFKYELK